MSTASLNNPFVYPQSPAAPISTNFLRDQGTSVAAIEKGGFSGQIALSIGSAVPIVFGKFIESKGGVWVNSPAARYGLQLKDTDNSSFSFGLVISDGRLGPIDESDIYKGSFNLSDLPNRNFTNAYGFMPEVGYDYSFSETTTTPGTPGTDDTVTVGDTTVSINKSNTTLWNTSSFSTFVTYSGVKSINVRLTVNESLYSSNTVPFAWRVLANNIVIASGTSSGGSASVSYNAGSSAGWRFELKNSSGVPGNVPKLTVSGTGTKTKTTVIPGEPTVPPVYTTSGLPLYPGAGGNFLGLTCLAVRGDYTVELGSAGTKEQVRCFVRNGIQVKNVETGSVLSSNNFIDLAYYLLKVNNVSDSLIDLNGFRDARQFLSVNNLSYNGVVVASVNLRDFFSSVAPGQMLKFVQDSGQFSFKPVLPIDGSGNIDTGTVEIAKLFSNDNIVAGSFRKSFYDSSFQKPFCALMSWREQFKQPYSNLINTEIRYAETAVDGPFETYDYSDFITDVNHAATVGSYILSSRARTTHTISFSTYLDSEDPNGKLAGELRIMDVIHVIGVNNSTLVQNQFYQIDSILENADGSINIEAIHFPADETGASLVAADVTAFVPPLTPEPIPDYGPGPSPDPDPDPDPTPSGYIGVLAITPPGYIYSDGMPITLTASYDGLVTDVVFNWFGPAGSNAPLSTTSNVLSWTAGGAEDAGGYSVVAVSPTAPDSGKQVSVGLEYKPFYIMSGGSVSTVGDFRIHTFVTGGTLTIDFAPFGKTFEYLICGPGGGVENGFEGGGAGGGGVLTGSTTQNIGNYPIGVGITGGVGAPKTAENQSSAFGLTALHGGDGGKGRIYASIAPAQDGACGGGSIETNPYTTYRPGVGSQGGNGGQGSSHPSGPYTRDQWGGGGGGASGANGTVGSASQAGTGGEGVNSSISGTSYVYGSGGGGALSANGAASRAPGGTGAGEGGGGWSGDFYKAIRPTNYGAGASCGNWNSTGDDQFIRGIQGIVIVRYRYR